MFPTPVRTVISFVIARLRLHNSATLQVLTLVSQGEKELMAQVDVSHITAIGSVIAVIIIVYFGRALNKYTLNEKV